jgi:Flp pilus assembly protein TadD
MIATDPQCHQAYYLLGRTCVTLGKGEQALELIARAAEIKPDAAPYHTELGNVLAMEEQFEDAADAYRRATELAPDFIDPHVNLGAVLQLLGRYAEAVMIYRKSTELAPDAAMLVFNMAEAQRAMGQGKASIDAYRQAVVLEPSWAVLHAKLGDALADHGDTAEAVECCRQAVELAPEEADHHIGLARALLSAGAGRSALSTCDAYMASHPYHSGLLAFRALLLNETGSQPAAERLLGLETLVRCVDVAVPTAFGTIEAFNSALSEEVEQRFEPEYDPDRQVTRNGKQSTSLFFRPGPGVALLMERIDEAVRAYISDLPDDPNHPLIGHVPDRWRLSGWSVTLEPHGFQTAHIGVEGWLGGLYAVEPRNGIVEVGAPPENWSFSVAPPLKSFELARGQLMLFPSYVYRRLPATGVTRCYIAFEIVAEG